MKLPTEPGFYWWRNSGDSQWHMLRVSPSADKTKTAVWFMGDTAPIPTENLIGFSIEVVKCDEPS